MPRTRGTQLRRLSTCPFRSVPASRTGLPSDRHGSRPPVPVRHPGMALVQTPGIPGSRSAPAIQTGAPPDVRFLTCRTPLSPRQAPGQFGDSGLQGRTPAMPSGAPGILTAPTSQAGPPFCSPGLWPTVPLRPAGRGSPAAVENYCRPCRSGLPRRGSPAAVQDYGRPRRSLLPDRDPDRPAGPDPRNSFPALPGGTKSPETGQLSCVTPVKPADSSCPACPPKGLGHGGAASSAPAGPLPRRPLAHPAPFPASA
jgi:hypothetical protein